MANSDLLARLKKASIIEEASVLSSSKVLEERDVIETPVYAMNIAFSGKLHGGFGAGLSLFCGSSKTFKSAWSLMCAKSYMDKYEDGIVLFHDSEMGASQKYFESFDIDMGRVLHIPIVDVEELKFDVMKQLQEIKRGDHVMIIVDSIGNLASKKEVEDTLEEKSVADMTRAKQIKSLTRMITPHLNLKNIPMIMIAHTYKEMSLFPKDIVSGGCVVAGTKIMMADGSYKAVENIIVGEKVKTLEGDKEVTHTWNPETLEVGEPECYEVEFEDGFKVVCSDKHKFLIDGEWVEAKDLKVDDEVDQL